MSKETVRVPDIGGVDAAEVVELLVSVGDEVALDQGLLVLESDKASMEIPSTAAGTVVEILAAEGAQLAEGDAVVVIEVAGDAPAAAAPESAESVEAPQASDPGAAAADESSEAQAVAPAQEAPAASSIITVAVPDIGTEDAVDVVEVSVAEETQSRRAIPSLFWSPTRRPWKCRPPSVALCAG